MSMPPAVPMGDPTAVMGRRIGAYIIDVILGWIVLAALFLALGDSVETQGVFGCGGDGAPSLCVDVGDKVYFADDGDDTAISLLSVGFWFLMGAVVQGITGGTPGKLAVGLRVVDKDTGLQASFGKAAARTVMWVVDAFPFFFPLVGLITGLATKGHRRVGDLVAGTLVVDKNSVGTPPAIPGLTPATADGFTPSPPGGAYTPPPPQGEPVAETAGAEAGDGIDAPKWDAERGAYIQWDKEQQKWMTYDDAAAQWKPLS